MSTRKASTDPVLGEYVHARLHSLTTRQSSSPAVTAPTVVSSTPAHPLAAEHPSGSVHAADGPLADSPQPSSRRFLSFLENRIPAVASPPAAFLRSHGLVVCGLIVVGVIIAASVVWASTSTAVTNPVATQVSATSPGANSESPSPASVESPPQTPAASASIRVHVIGAVPSPGVVSVPQGARVIDAVNAAGGLANQADPADLNLASQLSDGSQIVIGTSAKPRGNINTASSAPASSASPSSSTSASAPSGLINLNTATQEQLMTLPGIGPATAGKILQWRDDHGSFRHIEELQEIPGIGEKTFSKLASQICV